MPELTQHEHDQIAAAITHFKRKLEREMRYLPKVRRHGHVACYERHIAKLTAKLAPYYPQEAI